jgi:hypothetical protein
LPCVSLVVAIPLFTVASGFSAKTVTLKIPLVPFLKLSFSEAVK